eukprot:CAMPEP_0194736320 /NCGR_PEP_ID=MMETSP0296-20130528/76944_1 /TAXON_ID=39354 /ORGANISM="Heterosigma akashiwo, Strain CCMP2393" /LENGTH=67 /DNA_ID=CAMNT_0039645847 /DNA_START=132 /DNA_END=332 /DNA_ORIENTATION=+
MLRLTELAALEEDGGAVGQDAGAAVPGLLRPAIRLQRLLLASGLVEHGPGVHLHVPAGLPPGAPRVD